MIQRHLIGPATITSVQKDIISRFILQLLAANPQTTTSHTMATKFGDTIYQASHTYDPAIRPLNIPPMPGHSCVINNLGHMIRYFGSEGMSGDIQGIDGVTSLINKAGDIVEGFTGTTPAAQGSLLVPISGTTSSNGGGYAGDTGLDINCKIGTPVILPADSYLIYSEYGHSTWGGPADTNYSVLVELKTPLVYKGETYYYMWFAHLSKLVYNKPDNGKGQLLQAGTVIGYTGIANSSPHLHFGILKDRRQGAGDCMPYNDIHDILYGRRQYEDN